MGPLCPTGRPDGCTDSSFDDGGEESSEGSVDEGVFGVDTAKCCHGVGRCVSSARRRPAAQRDNGRLRRGFSGRKGVAAERFACTTMFDGPKAGPDKRWDSVAEI